MARRKTTADEGAPKKRAPRKKAAPKKAVEELEADKVEGAIDEAEEESPDEAEEESPVEAEAEPSAEAEAESPVEEESIASAEAAPTPEEDRVSVPSEPAPTPKKRAPAKVAAPRASTPRIDSLIPAVSLALLERHAALPATGAITDAFATHYAEALERLQQALLAPSGELPDVMEVSALEGADVMPPPPIEVDVPPPFIAVDEDEGGFFAEVDLEQSFESLPLESEAPDVVAEPADEDPADEATVSFDPSELLAAIDGEGEAPAEVAAAAEDTAPEADLGAPEAEAASEEAEAEDAPEDGAAVEAGAAEAPKKRRKSKRKR